MRCATASLSWRSDSEPGGLLSLSTYEQPLRAAGRVVPASAGEVAPISRALFYKLVRRRVLDRRRTSCSSAFPAFAALLGVEEYELFAAAGLLRPGLDAPLTIASAARQVRQASRLHLSRPHRGRRAQLGRGDHRRPDPAPQTRLPGLHLARASVVTAGPCTCIPWSPCRPLEPDHSKQRKKTADIERLPLHERRDHIQVQRHLRRDLALLRDDVARGGRPVEPRQGAADDRAADRGTQPAHPRRDRLPGPAGLPAPRARAAVGPRRS